MYSPSPTFLEILKQISTTIRIHFSISWRDFRASSPEEREFIEKHIANVKRTAGGEIHILEDLLSSGLLQLVEYNGSRFWGLGDRIVNPEQYIRLYARTLQTLVANVGFLDVYEAFKYAKWMCE